MERGDIAKNLFLSGYNCAQAVVLAFKNETGISEEDLIRLSVGFGGGLARQRLTCGAVSGMAMVLGAIYKDKSKAEVYSIIQNACNDYKAEVGSLVCGELLSGINVSKGGAPEERTDEYYKKRPCADLVKLAAEITEKYL